MLFCNNHNHHHFVRLYHDNNLLSVYRYFLLYLQFLCRLRLYYIHIYTYTPTHRYIHNTQIDTQIHTYIYNIYICIYCVSMLMKYIFWLYSKTLQPITLQTVKSILRWWLLLSTAAFLFNTPLPVTSSP